MKTHENSAQDNIASAEPTPLPCRYLRCKEVYYGAADDDEYASGQFWCHRTQDALGPDREPCGKKECCAKRTCYVT